MNNNPLFTLMNGQQNGMMQRLQKFQQMIHGDPQQQVQQLLNSGRVSQAQYDQAVQMARQIQRTLGIK